MFPNVATPQRGTKDEMIRVRVNSTELKRWRKAAKRAGKDSLSAWLRAIVARELADQGVPTKQAARISNDVLGAARRALGGAK